MGLKLYLGGQIIVKLTIDCSIRRQGIARMSDLGKSATPEEVEEARWRAQLEEIPTVELLELALGLSIEDAELDRRWDVVDALRTRGDEQSFDAAQSWCTGNDLVERELAADLLGQFGWKWKKDKKEGIEYPFIDRAMPLLETLLDDTEARVIASAVYCLWHYDGCVSWSHFVGQFGGAVKVYSGA